jgi:hypothetical protein
LVRRRRSRESDAGSGKRRLIFCPSPFAAARLPFAPPSSLPSFCARSVCPPYPFLLLLCFHGLASLFPGLLPVRPGFRAAIPGENLVRPGFSAWRNPALAVGDPGAFRYSIGLPDWPRGIRTAPGDGPRRDPGSGGGAAASGPSSAISGITNGIISGINSGITKGGERGGRSSAPGFLRAFRRSIGRPDGSRRWIPPGLGGRRRRGGLMAEQCH